MFGGCLNAETSLKLNRYFLNVLVDTTIGVYILVMFLKMQEWIVNWLVLFSIGFMAVPA